MVHITNVLRIDPWPLLISSMHINVYINKFLILPNVHGAALVLLRRKKNANNQKLDQPVYHDDDLASIRAQKKQLIVVLLWVNVRTDSRYFTKGDSVRFFACPL